MAKILVKASAAGWASANKADYKNSIVFLPESLEIVVDGVTYGLSAADAAKLAKIEALETKVNGMVYVTGVQVGDLNYSVGATGPIKVTGENAILVSLDSTKGLVLNLTVAEGKTNGTIAVNGTDVKVHGLGTAAYAATSAFGTAADVTALKTSVNELKTADGVNVKSVSGSNAISVSDTDAQNPVVSLKTNNNGNVKFTVDANGLAANVAIAVSGVAASEKVLALSSGNLSATLSLGYDSATKKIQLKGINNAVLSEVDASDFIVDGMLDNVALVGNNLEFTFNSAAGKEKISVDLTKYIDAYDGSNLRLKSITVPDTYSAPAANDSLDSAIGNLMKKDSLLEGEISNLSDRITEAASGGLISITKGTDGKYVTTTVSAKTSGSLSIGVAVTTKSVSSATSSDDGLALASDVKTYCDSLLEWEEL